MSKVAGFFILLVLLIIIRFVIDFWWIFLLLIPLFIWIRKKTKPFMDVQTGDNEWYKVKKNGTVEKYWYTMEKRWVSGSKNRKGHYTNVKVRKTVTVDCTILDVERMVEEYMRAKNEVKNRQERDMKVWKDKQLQESPTKKNEEKEELIDYKESNGWYTRE